MNSTQATLKMFNAIQIFERKENTIDYSLLSRMIKNGYIVDSSVNVTPKLLNTIENILGISGEKANSSFHKSWRIVSELSDEELIIQQIIHYFTTYGFESLGIYNEKYIYIPNEVLELPDNFENIPLIVVRGLFSDEIIEEVIKLTSSGIALSQESLDCLITIVKEFGFPVNFIDDVKNREFKIFLYDFLNVTPTNPVEFLRYVIYKLTGETLIIKNKYLIGKILQSDSKMLDSFLHNTPENLGSIFLRYKPLFLAMKKVSRNKTFFNYLRKTAVYQHEPLQEDYLNNITSYINNHLLNMNELNVALNNYPVFRKIKLAYALKNRLTITDSIVYKVRNGKGWVSDVEWNQKNNGVVEIVLNKVLQSIANDISENVGNKIFYIPSNVHYTLPATEKQFTGNFPTNTYFSVPEDLIVGIHWFDNDDKRVDIDLSLIDNLGKIGWDSSYRSTGREILFSGDMTAAPKPNGASELFYIAKRFNGVKLLMANYFNMYGDNDLVNDCHLIIANEKPRNFDRNYMIDVNNLVASVNVKIDKKQNMLGMIVNIDGENRVYLSDVSVGNGRTSSANNQTEKMRNFFTNTAINSIKLKDVLELAGAIVVNELPEADVEYFDLSPEALNKTTIISLFQ